MYTESSYHSPPFFEYNLFMISDYKRLKWQNWPYRFPSLSFRVTLNLSIRVKSWLIDRLGNPFNDLKRLRKQILYIYWFYGRNVRITLNYLRNVIYTFPGSDSSVTYFLTLRVKMIIIIPTPYSTDWVQRVKTRKEVTLKQLKVI